MVKLKKGALYLVTGGDYLNGDVVELTNNDGSEMPGFKSVETGISRFIYTKHVQRLKKLNKKNARRNSSRYNSELLNQLKHDKDVYLLDTGKKGYPKHGETPNCFEMFVDGKRVGTQYIWKSEIGKGKKTKIRVGNKIKLAKKDETTRRYGYASPMLDIGDIITVDKIDFTHDGEAKIRHDCHTYALSDFELVTDDDVLAKETKDALDKEMSRLQHLSVPKFRVIDGRGHCFSIGEILVLADGRNLGSGSKNFKRLERHDGTTQFLQDHQVELVK